MPLPSPWFPAMEPNHTPDPALADILTELTAREPIFHHPEFGTSRADFDRMMAPDFWEVSASGRRFSRTYVLDLLTERHAHGPIAEELEASDFHCQQLSPDTYLLTYTLRQDGTRWTRRSTLWRATPQGWQIVFHQGTEIRDPESTQPG